MPGFERVRKDVGFRGKAFIDYVLQWGRTQLRRITRMDKGKQPTPAAAPAQNMWPGALTEEEQKTVTDFDVNCRSFMVALSQLTILGSKIAAGWAGGIADLVNSLASTDLIP